MSTLKFRLSHLAILAMIGSFGFSCVAPLNTTMESARTLRKGETEVMGSYARYVGVADGESNAVNNNVGLRFGYGISDPLDIKFRYVRLFSTIDEEDTDANYLAVAPKYSLKEDRVAITAPIGAYFAQDESTWFTSPQVILTHPFPSNKVDITFASKVDFYFEKESDPTVGLNLGAGFSNNLDLWSIRPEVGYMFSTAKGRDGGYWAFGVGVTRNLQVWRER